MKEDTIALVASTDSMALYGMERLLTSQSGMVVTAICDLGEKLINCAIQLRPQIVILDDILLDFGVIRRLKTLVPHTKIILLTIPDNMYFFLEALTSGATGFLCRSTPVDELIQSIRTVSAGKVVIESETIQIMSDYLPYVSSRKKPKQMLVNGQLLTRRELEVLYLIARGYRNKEIATELQMSERSVKTHVAGLFAKLAVNSRSQAVFAGVKQKIISPSELD